MRANGKEIFAGVLFVAIGASACWHSYVTLQMGDAVRMGPGYFPFLLGLGLIAFGVTIACVGLSKELSPSRPVPWRAIVLIAAAPVVFALTVDGLGLVISTALACLVASLAASEVSLVRRLALTAILTGICLAVFYAGLHISVPLFGAWLTS